MRNLLAQRPTGELHGGPAFTRSFVDPEDLRGQAVLDIGCGFGWFEVVALEHDARSIIGIEPTARDLVTARQHLRDDRVKLVVASALELPVEDGEANTVVCWEVLEHLPQGTEPIAFAEAARALSPGGVLYLSTPFADLRSRLTDPAWWLTGHRHYRAEHIRALAEGAGLIVEKLFVKGGWWQVLLMTNLYIAKWIFRRPPFLEKQVNSRVDVEWSNEGGFTNLFLKARKP